MWIVHTFTKGSMLSLVKKLWTIYNNVTSYRLLGEKRAPTTLINPIFYLQIWGRLLPKDKAPFIGGVATRLLVDVPISPIS